MENQRLIEIRNNLRLLPVLENRLAKLNQHLYEAERNVQELLNKLDKESFDVERIEKDSLSATLLKFIGKYDGKLNKEMQEMFTAKINYDKAADRVKELCNERNELMGRISVLKNEKQVYEDELRKREDIMMHNITNDISNKFRELEKEQESLIVLSVETDEAIRAANRVKSTANNAMEHLDSAEDWATYDVWVKGGVFSHMAKYDHIDDAQSEFNRLTSQLEDLQKELQDVELSDTFEIVEIDTTTRVIDFWFDNIFTDLNVRDKIREDMDQLKELCKKIDSIIYSLEKNKSEIHCKANDIEHKKNDILINLNTVS